MFSFVEGSIVGFVVGAFTPAVGRKIKSLFAKEATVVKADVKADAVNIEKKL